MWRVNTDCDTVSISSSGSTQSTSFRRGTRSVYTTPIESMYNWSVYLEEMCPITGPSYQTTNVAVGSDNK